MDELAGLKSLLRLRESLERAARLELQQVCGEISRQKLELERIVEERCGVRAQLSGRLKKGLAAADFGMYSVKPLEVQEESTKTLVAKLETLKVQAEKKYGECRRERKVLEKMIERRRREYRMETERRAQRVTDDATLRRMGRLRLG